MAASDFAREDHHDLNRLYQPQPEEGFDDLDRAAYDAAASLDEGDARAFLSDADADELWDDADTADWRDAMDEREPDDQFRDNVDADADALRMAGWGMDEDYGYYGYGDE